MIKLVRIGKDAELRSANGKPVLSLSVVYDVDKVNKPLNSDI